MVTGFVADCASEVGRTTISTVQAMSLPGRCVRKNKYAQARKTRKRGMARLSVMIHSMYIEPRRAANRFSRSTPQQIENRRNVRRPSLSPLVPSPAFSLPPACLIPMLPRSSPRASATVPPITRTKYHTQTAIATACTSAAATRYRGISAPYPDGAVPKTARKPARNSGYSGSRE